MSEVCKTLNTKIFCFFCLQTVVKVKKESISDNGEDNNEESDISEGKETPPDLVSLSCLRRHLKLNCDGFPSSEGPSSEDLKVNVCSDCEDLVIRHSGLFQQLERIQMELDDYQKRIHFRIKKGMKNSKLFARYSKEMVSDRKTSSQLAFIDKLRTEILNKCSLATQNVPYRCRVKLNKLQQDNQSETSPEDEEQSIPDIKTEETALDESSMNIPSPSLPDDAFEEESTDNSSFNGDQINETDLSSEPETTSKSSSKTRKKQTKSSIQEFSVKLPSGKFQCKSCEKQYLAPGDARDHYKVVHLNEMWKCDICNIAAFRTRGSLVKHKRICVQFPKRQSEMQDLEKSFKFPCPTCGKRFPFKHQLTDHRKQVHPPKMFSCNQCSKSFKSNVYLNIHMSSVHLKKTWPCRYCSKEFTQPSKCKIHENICSERGSPEEETSNMKFPRDPVTRRVPCPSCSKTFTSTSYARVHYDFVHLDRKLICDICGREFKNLQTMKQHKAVTHDGKKYFCKFCNKAYRWNSKYYAHQKSCPQRSTPESEEK